MKYLIILLIVFAPLTFCQGQNSTIQVNSDGTHTIIYHNGNTSTQVNPDGTHTLIHHNGNTSTQVNSQGTHTVIHQGDSTKQAWYFGKLFQYKRKKTKNRR